VPDVKVIDFGLARRVDAGAQGTMLTDVGRVKGTLPYMSPEQVRGNVDEIDTRSDVYSLGVILYEMLCGALPYDVSRAALPEAVRTICEEPPRPLTTTGSGVRRLDGDVATIVGKALEKEPARRYPSAQALAEDVQRYLTDQPIQARPPSAAYQLRKLVARHRAVFGFAAALFVVLAVSTVGLALLAARNARERDRASQAAETATRVSEFLVSLFQVSDPGESRGNAVTAREILDAGAERIGKELMEQPLIRARLLDTMGNVYRSLGLYDRAEPLLREGLEVREAELGSEHPDVAVSLTSMAALRRFQGRAKEGSRDAERAIGILGGAGAGEQIQAAWAHYYLGLNEIELGREDRAQGELKRALTLFERHLGRMSVPVAWCLNDLGNVYYSVGDLRNAQIVVEQSLTIKERLYDTPHPDVAVALNQIGYLYSKGGDYSRAKPLLEKAIAMSEATYGREHPVTANILQSLGELLLRTGDRTAARDLLHRALRIQEAKLDPGHYELALTRCSLAAIAAAEGNFDQADALYRQAVPVFDRRGLSQEAAIALEEYAGYLNHRGRRAEAGKYAERARQIRAQSNRARDDWETRGNGPDAPRGEPATPPPGAPPTRP
jgi:tetratricopeptide (TPR) repeat protein